MLKYSSFHRRIVAISQFHSGVWLSKGMKHTITRCTGNREVLLLVGWRR